MCEDGRSATLCIVQIFYGRAVPAYVWESLRVTTANGNPVSLLVEVDQVPPDVRVTLHPINRFSMAEDHRLRLFRQRYVQMGQWEPYEQQCGERWFVLLAFLNHTANLRRCFWIPML